MLVNSLESLITVVIKHTQSIYRRFFIVRNQDIGHPVSLRRILALTVKDYLPVRHCLKPVPIIPPGIDYRLRGLDFFRELSILYQLSLIRGKASLIFPYPALRDWMVKK